MRAIRLCHQSLKGTFTFHPLPQSSKATDMFLEFCYTNILLSGTKTHSSCYDCNINYLKTWQLTTTIHYAYRFCGSGTLWEWLHNICEMEDLKFGNYIHLKSHHSHVWKWINHSLWSSVPLYVVSLNMLSKYASSYHGGWVLRACILKKS